MSSRVIGSRAVVTAGEWLCSVVSRHARVDLLRFPQLRSSFKYNVLYCLVLYRIEQDF